MRRQRLALAAIGLGLAAVVVVQRLSPVAGPPLFDGVIVEAPYQWLSPPAGHAGGAQGVSQSVPVQGNKSPDMSVGTSENPPQAQVFAGAGFLSMPSGTTSIHVSIQPVSPVAQPSSGVIAGNVYRFSLTDQNGQAVAGQASGGVTIELRGPPNLTSATIDRFANGAWTPIGGDSVGQPNIFTAVATDFGDFALVAPPGWTPAAESGGNGGPAGPQAPGAANTPTAQPSQGPIASNQGFDPTPIILGGGVVLVVLVVAVVLLLYARRTPRPPTPRRSPAAPSRSARSRPPERPAPISRKRRRHR